jgi:hypothetical protein
MNAPSLQAVFDYIAAQISDKVIAALHAEAASVVPVEPWIDTTMKPAVCAIPHVVEQVVLPDPIPAPAAPAPATAPAPAAPIEPAQLTSAEVEDRNFLQALMLDYISRCGRDTVVKTLASFGAKKATELTGDNKLKFAMKAQADIKATSHE